MPLSKRSALGVSLSAIVLYWCWQIFAQRAPQPLPAQFSDFALRVVRSKLLVGASLFVLLRLEGEGLASLGCSSVEWRKRVGVGLAAGLAMFVGFNVALDSLFNALIPKTPTSGVSVLNYFEAPANLLLWLPIGVFGGGVIEELQRVFIITRFERWLGRPGLILGVALSSAMFGFGHRYQGLGTALSTGVAGVAFARLYLRRRSALEPITAHAAADVLAILAATLLAK